MNASDFYENQDEIKESATAYVQKVRSQNYWNFFTIFLDVILDSNKNSYTPGNVDENWLGSHYIIDEPIYE